MILPVEVTCSWNTPTLKSSSHAWVLAELAKVERVTSHNLNGRVAQTTEPTWLSFQPVSAHTSNTTPADMSRSLPMHVQRRGVTLKAVLPDVQARLRADLSVTTISNWCSKYDMIDCWTPHSARDAVSSKHKNAKFVFTSSRLVSGFQRKVGMATSTLQGTRSLSTSRGTGKLSLLS